MLPCSPHNETNVSETEEVGEDVVVHTLEFDDRDSKQISMFDGAKLEKYRYTQFSHVLLFSNGD